MGRFIIFVITILCFALSGEAFSQRCLHGMQGIQITTGMADGFYGSDNRNETGFYWGVSLSSYAKNGNKWMFGAEYLKRNYPYKENRIPVQQFTGEGGYYLNFLSDAGMTFFFSLGLSAMAGYETVNKGNGLLFDGATLENRDRFLYGGALTLEMEVYLNDRIVLLLTGRERILGGSSVAKFHAQFGIGVKFIIN